MGIYDWIVKDCPVCGQQCETVQSYMGMTTHVRVYYCRRHGEFNTVQKLTR